MQGFVQVKEHLELFATIKGVDENSLECTVIEMVDEVSCNVTDFFIYYLRTFF